MKRDVVGANIVIGFGVSPIESLGVFASGGLSDPRVTDIK